MSHVLDRAGLAAGLDSAGITWRELSDAERRAFAVDAVEPSAICWPATYAEAASVLALADRLAIAVAPRGAGTKIGLGNPPRACDLIVSTERLDRVIDYAPANLTVTIQSGMSLDSVQACLAEGGQYLALDPPHADRATIGGILATNASGPRRFGLGSARDLVIGTQVATTRGTVTKAGGRVVKNVAGYDLNKLYIGSLGTLALIVEASFKVTPRPSEQSTVIARFASGGELAAAVQAIVRSPLMPTAVDLLNAPAVRRLASPGVPEPGDGYLLATLGTAPGKALARQRDDLRRICREAGADEVAALDTAASADFWSRVAGLMTGSADPGAICLKIAVPIGRVPVALRALEHRRASFGGLPAVSGRAGTGVLYARWDGADQTGPAQATADSGSLAMVTADGQLPAVATAITELRAECRALGGSLVVEECPRALKDYLDVWGEVGAQLSIMKRLKAALDPGAVLNPGRFVGGI